MQLVICLHSTGRIITDIVVFLSSLIPSPRKIAAEQVGMRSLICCNKEYVVHFYHPLLRTRRAESPIIHHLTPLSLSSAPSLQELRALEGQSVTLRCKAVGDPDPVVHWIAPDGRLMSNSSRAAVHADGTLDILISTVKDSGVCLQPTARPDCSLLTERN